MWITTAQKLGLKNIENVKISIDECITKDTWHRENVAKNPYGLGPIVLAHYHGCHNDPDHGTICIPSWGILNADKDISVILWHEYGHHLAQIKVFCDDHVKIDYDGLDMESVRNGLINRAHGPAFQEVMASLGMSKWAKPVIDFSLGM